MTNPDPPTLGSVLLTGATGLVGSHVLRLLLAEGYRVRALRRSDSSLSLLPTAVIEQTEWAIGDLLDVPSLEDAMQGISTVVHAAALVSFQRRDHDQLMLTNVTGTANVVNVALASGVKRLVHVSSVAVLGRSTHGEVITESSHWQDDDATTIYARSKFGAECEVWRGQAEGLSVAAVYPTTVLGAGDWRRGSAQLFALLDQGINYYPTGTGGLVDVQDVATALLRVLERHKDGDRFLLNADNWSYQRLFADIAQALGHPVPRRPLAGAYALGLRWLATLYARWQGTTAPLTRESLSVAQSHFRYDNHRSVTTLGMQYRSVSDTIATAVAAYRRTEQGTPIE